MVKVSIPEVLRKDMDSVLPGLQTADRKLQQKTGAGSDFTGWVTLPGDYDKDEFTRIQKAAEKIRKDSKVLVVIGIGGSYLGPRAVIELLHSSFYNALPGDGPEIYFVGNNLSGDYLQNIISLIGGRDFSINVISKSGTTTEPAVAFRIFKKLLEDKYGGAAAAAGRIYATTDKARGTLKGVADAMGYETFVVPDDVGGRYSVLSAVGLLPIAAAGIDIQELIDGAGDMMALCQKDKSFENPAFAYAAARNLLYQEGKKIEVLASFDPDFMFMAEWWKQLFGESEGKENKGLFPASLNFTADLHSMGQYMQEGERNLLETMMVIGAPEKGLAVEKDEKDADGLNFLAGKTVDAINTAAFQGTFLAHTDGGVPVLTVDMGHKTARDLGMLIYFFEYACGLSGYLLDVNPFNQPGVEAYKKNMFALLNKPGFEAEGAALRARLDG